MRKGLTPPSQQQSSPPSQGPIDRDGGDVLVVDPHDFGLVDLDSPSCQDFSLYTGALSLQGQQQTTNSATATTTTATTNPTRKVQKMKPEPIPPARYGHSSHRVKEINEENARLVRRLATLATASPSLKNQSTTKEHDLVSFFFSFVTLLLL